MQNIDPAWALMHRANDASDAGRYDEALELYDEVAAHLADHPDRYTDATLQMERGITLERLGRYSEARERYEEALVGYDEVGDKADGARVRQNLGGCLQALGEHEGALLVLRHARQAWVELHEPSRIADCDVNMANILSEDPGRWEEALELYHDARIVYLLWGPEVEVADCDDSIGWLLAERGRYDEARVLQLEARRIYLEHDVQRELAHCERNLGHTELHAGRPDEALRWLTSARDRYAALGLDHEIVAVDTLITEVG